MKLGYYFRGNKFHRLINAVGLGVALASLLVVLLYVQREFSYDAFHSKADRIFRLTLNTNTGASAMHAARVYGAWPFEMAATYPSVEKITRLVPYRRCAVAIDEELFYSENAFATDSTFFEVFDFEVLLGKKEGSFSAPGEAYITESLAKKYFGSVDVLGRTITLTGRQDSEAYACTVQGVLADFPRNSHFHAEILTSLPRAGNMERWAYTYLLLKDPQDAAAIVAAEQAEWDREATDKTAPTIHLQNIQDIHLRSHKTRELEKNRDIRSIYMLVSGVVIILLITLVNFVNLKRVAFLSSLSAFKIKIINGAKVSTLIKEQLLQMIPLVMAFLSLALSLLYVVNDALHLGLVMREVWWSALWIILFFVLGVLLLSVYPFFFNRIEKRIGYTPRQGRVYLFPLVVQFTLAMVALTATIVLDKQLHFLQHQHPEADNEDMIVIPYNQMAVHQRYEVLKTKLLESPGIEMVSCAMEEPGGDINDGFPFILEGMEQTDPPLHINVLTTDDNFFQLLDIDALAGSLEVKGIPGLAWEKKAWDLSYLEAYQPEKKALIAKLREEVEGYKGRYIVNESALKMWGIADPQEAIGRMFRLDYHMPHVFPEGEIIGVVPDFHYTNLHRKERPLVVIPQLNFSTNYLVRFRPGLREQALADLRRVWQEVNPDMPLNYRYVSDTYQRVYEEEYSQARLLGWFSLMALFLVALGIYAIASFNIQRVTKEIGIRKVNGATVKSILVMLNRGFVKWGVMAFLVATPISYYAMNKWLGNFAYKMTLSWWIFALAGLLTLSIALLTVSWKSWRAARRNPVEALRYE